VVAVSLDNERWQAEVAAYRQQWLSHYGPPGAADHSLTAAASAK
jgi:hypothetical protein